MGYFNDLIAEKQAKVKQDLIFSHESFFHFLRALDANKNDIVSNNGIVKISDFEAEIVFKIFDSFDDYIFNALIDGSGEIRINDNTIKPEFLMAEFDQFLNVNATRIAKIKERKFPMLDIKNPHVEIDGKK